MRVLQLLVGFVFFFPLYLLPMQSESDTLAFARSLNNCDVDSCKRLLEGGMSANAHIHSGVKILGHAVNKYYCRASSNDRKKVLSIIEALLQKGADPNVYWDKNISIDLPGFGYNFIPNPSMILNIFTQTFATEDTFIADLAVEILLVANRRFLFEILT